MGWRGRRIEGGPVGLPQHEGLILEGRREGRRGEEGRGGERHHCGRGGREGGRRGEEGRGRERHHCGRGGREGGKDIIVISCHCY